MNTVGPALSLGFVFHALRSRTNWVSVSFCSIAHYPRERLKGILSQATLHNISKVGLEIVLVVSSKYWTHQGIKELQPWWPLAKLPESRSDLLAVFSLCWSHHHQNEVLNTLVYCRNTEASKKLTLVEVRGCVSVGNLCEHREFFSFPFSFLISMLLSSESVYSWAFTTAWRCFKLLEHWAC